MKLAILYIFANFITNCTFSAQELSKEIIVNELLECKAPRLSPVKKSDSGLGRPLVIFGCNGGGIRGYASSRVLEALEQAVGSKDKPFPVQNMIHASVGSSTGTIISAAITIDPKYWTGSGSSAISSASSIPALLAQMYKEEGPYIFSNLSRTSCCWSIKDSCIAGCFVQIRNIFGPKYNGRHLKEVMKKYFGNFALTETRTAFECSDLLSLGHSQHKIELSMVTCDMKTGTTFEFNSYDAISGKAPNFFMKDALYATCAQATTFPTASLNPIVGKKKHYDKTQTFNLIDEGPLDNPVFHALKVGFKQLKERGIDPIQYFHQHYQDYKDGKPVEPLLRIVHVSTGHHTTVLDPKKYHEAGLLTIAPALVCGLLENQSVCASDSVKFVTQMMPFVEFYNLEGETSISALEDDKATSEIFAELDRLAGDIVTNSPDFKRLAKDLKNDLHL